MVLNNVTVLGTDGPVNIQIRNNRIVKITKDPIAAKSKRLQLTFSKALAFPGLINSHDHLDFNLFPQLGDRTYNNYTEWGNYIHATYRNEIAAVLKVPVDLREQWGILKNLIAGVTMVVNHGEKLKTTFPLISVHEEYHFLHSVQFEKKWKMKLNNPLKIDKAAVIHVGEGLDSGSRKEIDQLIRWNIFRKQMIGVHAMAMSRKQAEKFRAIVWCPQSNFFMFNQTAPVDKLKKYTTVLFGTDSTLTSDWNIWNHIRAARKTGSLTDAELIGSLSANAANIWGTPNGEIKTGRIADIVIAKMKQGKSAGESFFATDPEDILLVLQSGRIRLFDSELLTQLTETDTSAFSKIYIGGLCKYVERDVPKLITAIQQYYSEANFPITID